MSRFRMWLAVVLVMAAALSGAMISAQVEDASKASKDRLQDMARRLLKSPSARAECESADVAVAVDSTSVLYRKVSIVDPQHKLQLKCESLRLEAPQEWLGKRGSTTTNQGRLALKVDVEFLQITGETDFPPITADRIALVVRDCDSRKTAMNLMPAALTWVGTVLNPRSADTSADSIDPALLPPSDQSAVLTVTGIKAEAGAMLKEHLEVEPEHLDRILRTNKMVLHAYYRADLKELETRLTEYSTPIGQSTASVVIQYGPEATSFVTTPNKVSLALKSDARPESAIKWTAKTAPGRRDTFSIGRTSLDSKLDMEFDSKSGQLVMPPKGYIVARIEDFESKQLTDRSDPGDSAPVSRISLGKLELSYTFVENELGVRLTEEKLNFRNTLPPIELAIGKTSVGFRSKVGPEEFRSSEAFFSRSPLAIEISLAGAKLMLPEIAEILKIGTETATKITQIDEVQINGSFIPKNNELAMDLYKLSGPLVSLALATKSQLTQNPFLHGPAFGAPPSTSLKKASATLTLDLSPGGQTFGDSSKTGSYSMNKGSIKANIDYDSVGSKDSTLDGLRMRLTTGLDGFRAVFAGPMKLFMEDTPLAKLDIMRVGELNVDTFLASADLEKGNLQIFRTKLATPQLTAALNADIDLDPGSAAKSVVKSSLLRVSNTNEKVKSFLKILEKGLDRPLPAEGDAVLIEATGPVNNLQLKGTPNNKK